ncbi:unnamed protein product [Trifolium pratense]|uniref:Uncharacterized protein n=1 Tax=Trifolium pratense TaxID=57577 RepID=A0ACB0IN79_TRIPR|nr:unnamed protein product [Trifolium pratense]
MGSNSRGKDGEGTSGINRFEDDEQEMNFVPSEILFLNTNGFVAPFVMPQVPGMQRPGGMMAQPHLSYVETVIHQRYKTVRISWFHGGINVTIAGSWNNWQTEEALQNVGENNFVIEKTLPIDIYYYRFNVDGQWTHAPEYPSGFNQDSGFGYNILDLQDYIPQRAENEVADPPSPVSSYDNIYEIESNKPPPELPPQIPVTLTEEASTSNTGRVPSFPHTQLNHLYKSDGDQFVALRSTQRFQQKFVTTVLYKSLHRET